MTYSKDFSIIIPHRNSVQYLPKLFSSIPVSDKIEIIIVDNSPVKVTKEDINIERDYVLIYSVPERGAGGARNEGMAHAHGKWLLFLDADDYYADGAFDIFYQHLNTDAEIVYTGMGGIYLDTGEKSARGDYYANLVRSYLSGEKSENDLRLTFSSPCCKMVSNDLVRRHNLLYDEVIASNDMYFSLISGYYAKKIEAIDFVSYIATVSRGSLTKRHDYAVRRARFEVNLRYNSFVKEHGLPQYQKSVMIYLFDFAKISPIKLCIAIRQLIIYKQNPFVGCSNWLSTLLKKDNDKKYNAK